LKFTLDKLDYISETQNITFLAGSTRAITNVTIIDDDEREDDENFTLSIVESTLPTCAFISDLNYLYSTSLSRVTIVDDDYDNSECFRMYEHLLCHPYYILLVY